MGAFSEAGTFIIQTLLELYLLMVLLRLLLQISRADFYNPISQAVVKVTDPPLKPLRRVIPSISGIDIASIVLALLVQFAAIYLICLINGIAPVNPVNALVWGIVGAIYYVANIYFFTLLVSIIVSWVAPGSFHPIVLLINQLVEPIMTPFRKLIPPIGGLDISPLFAFIAIEVIKIFIRNGAQALHVVPQLVLGI